MLQASIKPRFFVKGCNKTPGQHTPAKNDTTSRNHGPYSSANFFVPVWNILRQDPSLQDNVIIQRGFFQQIYHVGCAFNLHSTINNGLIPGGQNSSKRQTVFFLPFDPRDKGHQDPATIDFNKPRRAQYMHSAWKKHQDAVFWVDIDLANQKGLTLYQTRSNAIILPGILPAYCFPKSCQIEDWRSLL